MSKDELEALASRVEAAEPNMQGALLEAAWDALAQHSASFRSFATRHVSGFDNNAARFMMMLEASAYESAAIMLVPEGRFWTAHETANPDGRRSVFGHSSRCHASVEGGQNQHDYGKTVALALCAAALRARAIERTAHEQ